MSCCAIWCSVISTLRVKPHILRWTLCTRYRIRSLASILTLKHSVHQTHTWSGTERNSSRSGSHSNFFGSWSDLDPFLESWNGSGMDRFIRDKNQFSSGSYDNIFCKNSMSDSMDSIEVQIVWFLIEGATTLSRTTWSLLRLTYSCWKTFHQSKNCTEGWMLLPLHQPLFTSHQFSPS